MKSYGPVLLTVVVTAALLAGCSGADDPAWIDAAVPSPGAVSARDELVAALRRTGQEPYRFAVSADAPGRRHVRASGSVDPKARKLASSITITGGPDAGSTRRVVIGTDRYERRAGGRWTHLDMKRLRKQDSLRVDMADPIGLKAFTSTVDDVVGAGPHTYRGSFDPSPADTAAFLPIGAPSLWVVASSAGFTAVTGDDGRVTTIRVTLTVKQTLTMTTTFSALGETPPITKPANAVEAPAYTYG